MDTNGSKGWEGGPLDCGGLEASSFCPLGLRGVVVLGEEGVIGEVGSPSLFDSFGFDRDERRLFGGGGRLPLRREMLLAASPLCCRSRGFWLCSRRSRSPACCSYVVTVREQ